MRTYRTSELIAEGHLVIGDGYRAKNSELSEIGFPFARAGNINDGFHFEGADCLPFEDIVKAGDKVSQPRDIVFTSKGTVGRFAFVGDGTPRFVFSPQLCYWRILSDTLIDASWLYYWMQGREFFGQVEAVKGQTDMADYVSLGDQRKMEISLPPLPEQRRIAGILSAFDAKIDLLRRQNGVLAAMAGAVFRHYFIDGADGGEVATIRKLVDINPRERLAKGEMATYLDMRGVETKSSGASDYYERAFTSGTKFRNGDALLARITPCLENGKTAFVNFLGEDEVGWGSTEFLVLRTKPGIPAFVSYCLAKNPEFRAHAESTMTGSSGRQRVVTEGLWGFEVVVPGEERLGILREWFEGIGGRLRVSGAEIEVVTGVREGALKEMMGYG